MPELPSINGKEALKAFERAGFVVVRVSGSHHIMKRAGHPFLISVPVHGSSSMKSGTLRRLIRDSGLTVDEFSQLLK